MGKRIEEEPSTTSEGELRDLRDYFERSVRKAEPGISDEELREFIEFGMQDKFILSLVRHEKAREEWLRENVPDWERWSDDP